MDWSINKSNCFRLDGNDSIEQDTHFFHLFGINLASFKFDADVRYGTINRRRPVGWSSHTRDPCLVVRLLALALFDRGDYLLVAIAYKEEMRGKGE